MGMSNNMHHYAHTAIPGWYNHTRVTYAYHTSMTNGQPASVGSIILYIVLVLICIIKFYIYSGTSLKDLRIKMHL